MLTKEAFNSLTSSSRYHKLKHTPGDFVPPPSLLSHESPSAGTHYSLRKATKTLQFMERCTNLGWHVPSQQPTVVTTTTIGVAAAAAQSNLVPTTTKTIAAAAAQNNHSNNKVCMEQASAISY